MQIRSKWNFLDLLNLKVELYSISVLDKFLIFYNTSQQNSDEKFKSTFDLNGNKYLKPNEMAKIFSKTLKMQER